MPRITIHRVLPLELMSKIFVDTLDFINLDCSSSSFQPYDPFCVPPISPSSAPLSLLAVCRTWRFITLGTPALFTRIFLHGQRLSVNPAVVIPMWLEYSGPLPLDIVIQPERWSLDNLLFITDETHVCRLLNQIYRHNYRIRTLRISEFGSSLLLGSIQELQMPFLKELTLAELGSSKYNPYKIPRIVTPNLESLQMICPQWDAVIDLDRVVSGPKLRTYRNTSVPQTLPHLVGILRDNFQLETCILDRWESSIGAEVISKSIRLDMPRLRRLHLSEASAATEQNLHHLVPFLEALKIPVIEDLKLLSYIQWDTVTEEQRCSLRHAFHSLFPSNTSSLTTLHIQHFNLMDIDFVLLFPKMVSLQRLRIVDGGLCDDVIQVLALPHICPKLVSISLTSLCSDQTMLVSMLEIRLRTVPCFPTKGLQEIGIFCNGLSQKEQKGLNGLIKKYPGKSWSVWYPEPE